MTNVWQLIDVSSLAPNTPLTYSIAVNRLEGDAQPFQLRVSSQTSGLPEIHPGLGDGTFVMLVQNVPANTWTTLSIPFLLPPGAVALGVEIAHSGSIIGYADNAHLVPEPSSIVLAAMAGLCGLVTVARRKRNRVGLH